MKIKLKLILVILELVLIPLFFLIFVVYSNTQKTLSTNILGQLDTIAQIQKHRAQDFLDGKAALIKAISNDADLRATVAAYAAHPTPATQDALNATLYSIQNADQSYKSVAILNASGTVIASADPAMLGEQQGSSSFFIVGQTRDDASILFNDASSTGEYLVGPLSVNSEGAFVLVIKSDTTALANLFQDKSGLGTTGGWALITHDPAGAIVIVPTPTDPTTIPKLQAILDSGAPITPLLAALSGMERDFSNIKTYKGVPVLAATKSLSGPNWGVAVTIHQDEAYASINNLRNLIIFLIIIITAIIVLIGISIATSITDPIISLTQFANFIAAGDFSQKTGVASSDEIGELGSALNQMSSQLRELYMNMEGKIKQKADELQAGVAALQDAEAKAENQSQLLRSLVDNLPVGVLVANAPGGEVLVLNRVAMELFGRGIEAGITKENYTERYRFFTEEGAPFPIENFPVTMTFHSGRLESKEGIVIRRPDTSEVTVRVASSPVKDTYGNVLFVVALFEDTTATREEDKAKKEFIAMASDKLRAPLAEIHKQVEMLMTGAGDSFNNVQKKYATQIYDNSGQAMEMVQSLLDISNLEAGTFAMESKPTDFIVIAEDVLQGLQSLATSKKITLQKNLDSTLPLIPADRKLVRLILQNIVENAIKYTPEGGTVSLAMAKTEAAALITVRDSGYGIPVQEHHFIFKKFFRASNVLSHEPNGTGLGLYAAKLIIEQSGGTIHFESTEGQGTSFYIMIPLAGMERR